MIKKLICFFWGHKTVHKAYNGRSVKGTNNIGMSYIAPMFRYVNYDFCTRCGKKNVG